MPLGDRGDVVGDNGRTRGREEVVEKHSLWHDRIKGCPCRMPQSVTSISSSISGLRGASAREGRGGRWEGEADDVKSFKSLRSPLHDM